MSAVGGLVVLWLFSQIQGMKTNLTDKLILSTPGVASQPQQVGLLMDPSYHTPESVTCEKFCL